MPDPADTQHALTCEHLAVIMDGNGRWAQRRGEPRSAGHKAGVRATRGLVEHCLRREIGALTIFAFSTENWKRPPTEVSLLMELFTRSLAKEVDELHENGVRIRFIGDHARFAPNLQRAMERAEARTADNTALHLQIAVGYGGRDDMVRATRAIAEQVASGALAASAIDEAALSAHGALAGLPEPDLFVRTGGEQRISNFLLWDLAYTELYFTDTLWPDFDADTLDQALAWFTRRERRFGEVPAPQAGSDSQRAVA